MRKLPQTKAEYDALLAEFVKNMWPERVDGEPRGPIGRQPEVFIEKMNPRPHLHDVDVVLIIGGGRGGKTLVASIRAWQYALENPGCSLIVGSRYFTDFRQNVLEKYWQPAFTNEKEWDSGLIAKPWNEHRKEIRFTNKSLCYLIQLDKWQRIRGKEGLFIFVDEASLIEEAEGFEEACRRMSGSGAVRQILLTTNPEESFGWLYDTFNLGQFEPGYDGPEVPIGPECFCHFCTQCLLPKNGKKKIEYIEGECPDCGYKKKLACPGRQRYFRVIFMNPEENTSLPESYMGTQMGVMDEAKFEVYTGGKIKELRKGKVYHCYTKQNVFINKVEVDYDKDIFWAIDWNRRPQCSVIIQEDIGKEKVIGILDEIVIWEVGPEEIAHRFMSKFPNFKKTIYIVGDPAGLNLQGNTNKDEVNRFQYIYNVLVEGGYNVEIITQKIKGKTKVNKSNRLDNVNFLLRDNKNVIRLKVNPTCSRIMRSLEGVTFKNDSKTLEFNESGDRSAREATDHGKPFIMTHPADALGYYVMKRWPLVKDNSGNMFIQIPGEVVVDFTAKGYIERLYQEELRKAAPERQSFRDWIDEINELEPEDQSQFASFWPDF